MYVNNLFNYRHPSIYKCVWGRNLTYFTILVSICWQVNFNNAHKIKQANWFCVGYTVMLNEYFWFSVLALQLLLMEHNTTEVNIWSGSKHFFKVVLNLISKTHSCLRTIVNIFDPLEMLPAVIADLSGSTGLYSVRRGTGARRGTDAFIPMKWARHRSSV